MELTFTAKKKNYDHMFLLVSDPDFQEDVQEIRRNLGMPPRRFKTAADYDVWLVKAANGYAKLTDPEDRRLSTFMRFVNAPRLLAERYCLPGNYDRYIKEYILYGTVRAPLNNFEVGPSDGRAPTVNIYAVLTKGEMAELGHEVARVSPHLPKYQPLKDVEGKIASEKMVAERDAYNEDGGSEYALSLSEMAQGNAKKIYADIRELKDLRKKRFGK